MVGGGRDRERHQLPLLLTPTPVCALILNQTRRPPLHAPEDAPTN